MENLFTSRHAHASLDDLGVATLCLTDAKSLNILGAQSIKELSEALALLAADPRVRVLVLRGSGDNAFIGGADIHEMAQLTSQTAPAFINALKDFCQALRDIGVPVIARLSGWCLGAGLEVAAACDFRLCSEDARFGMPEVHVGIPSVIHAALVPRLIGLSRANWLLMTGDPIDAQTALHWGLVHSLRQTHELDAAVRSLAEKLMRLGPAVLRQQKRLIASWQELPLAQAIEASVPEFAASFDTGEPQHYMQAFVNRPRPAKPSGAKQALETSQLAHQQSGRDRLAAAGVLSRPEGRKIAAALGLGGSAQGRDGRAGQREGWRLGAQGPEFAHQAVHDATRGPSGEQIGQGRVARRLALQGLAMNRAGVRLGAK